MAISMFVISSNNRLRVLFDKIATVYFSGKIYLYFSTGNGQPREPCSIVPVGSAHFRSLALPGRLQTVLQFRALSQTYGSSSFDMRHVWTLNRITSHWTRPCGRPRTSWLREGVRLILMYSQSTSGSTQKRRIIFQSEVLNCNSLLSCFNICPKLC